MIDGGGGHVACDHQRNPRLVDEDEVCFIDDREVKRPLHDPGDAVDRVVAQVVEARLLRRQIGDIGCVGRLTL